MKMMNEPLKTQHMLLFKKQKSPDSTRVRRQACLLLGPTSTT